MNENHLKYLQQSASRYRSDLLDDILPFWLDHGLDTRNGGVFTCLNRDGTLMDPTKSVWFQGRFAYVSSLACNTLGDDPRWLAAAKSCLDFIDAHCVDKDGHMFFTVTADGKPVQKRRYVFSECFAAIAAAEYAKAAQDGSYAEKALGILLNMDRMLSTEGFLAPKTRVPSRGHSITMLLLNVADVVRQVAEHPKLNELTDRSIDELWRYFRHPEFRALLETVGPNGEFIDTNAGRTINPGHCLETAWFLLAEAEHRGWESQLTGMATEILDWSWEWGWDADFGGIINFRDCRDLPPQDYSQDMKFWWPQCEAIIATLYAYRATGDAKYLDMHRRIHDWTFAHFPDREYGEWYGYLHRDGTVAQPAKGNLFKGPFHVPRMLLVAGRLCEEILKNETKLNQNQLCGQLENFKYL